MMLVMALLACTVGAPLWITCLADPMVSPPSPRISLSADNVRQPSEATWVIPTATSEGQTELQAGWNLVCLRVAPSNSAIAQVLSSIAGHYEMVSSYAAASGTWLSYNPSLPGAATLHELHEDTAFWILMTQAGTLTVSGSLANSTSQQLYGGWNLVAYPAMESRDVEHALESISGHYTLVYGYSEGSSTSWRRYSTSTPTWANTLTSFDPGHGYWVNVTQNCTLSMDSGRERFGVAANGAITEYDYARLGIGWYHNWGVYNSAPDGLTYFATAGTYGKTVAQQSATIEAHLANYPERYPDGMVWFIGNEPGYDDGWFSPAEYAQFYHEWRTYLKGLNPSFQIGTGAIVPLSGLYIIQDDWELGIYWFSEVRAEYQALYGQEMPVDWYNIHTYLRADSEALFYDNIEQFRQRMASHWNARAKPLVITEMGNLVEDDTEVVQAMMIRAFDYLRTATSSDYGCTTDGNRLVQKWAWFALTGWSPSAGNHRWDTTALFDYDTKGILPLGETHASYANTYHNTTP